jgi:hypothetical protein
MGDAVRRGKWSDFTCLLAHRQWFYFGSFVPRGEAFLVDPAQRYFSASFFACNVFALLVTIAWLFRQVRRVWPLVVCAALLGAIWAQGSLIVPESRFLMVVHVVLWVLAAAAAHEFLPELYERWNLARLRSVLRLPVHSGKP